MPRFLSSVGWMPHSFGLWSEISLQPVSALPILVRNPVTADYATATHDVSCVEIAILSLGDKRTPAISVPRIDPEPHSA
jgi:hypothetical protein